MIENGCNRFLGTKNLEFACVIFVLHAFFRKLVVPPTSSTSCIIFPIFSYKNMFVCWKSVKSVHWNSFVISYKMMCFLRRINSYSYSFVLLPGKSKLCPCLSARSLVCVRQMNEGLERTRSCLCLAWENQKSHGKRAGTHSFRIHVYNLYIIV